MAQSKSNPPTAAQKRLAAERAAAARQRIEHAQRRRRLWVLVSAVGAVVVIVAAFAIVKAVTGDNGPKSGKKSTVAAQSVTQDLADVPASVFDSVGTGTATQAPQTISQTALTSDGKPEVLYIGAEWCPYCAAERWSLAVALSRFGSFTGLGETSSSPTDVDPNTATLSFHGATYTSKYLSFVGREIYSNQAEGSSYKSLDKLTAAQTALFKQAQGFPYINIAGKYLLNTSGYDGGVLKGMDQKQIASQLSSSSSAVTKGIVGQANVLTATLCKVTKDQPAAVCSSSGVTTAAAALAKAGSGS